MHLRLKILEEVVFAPKQLSLDQEETLKGLKAGINVDATESIVHCFKLTDKCAHPILARHQG